jgi:CubicO group peptidase (beta-lactamase class C family)
VLAHIVELLSGTSFNRFLEERIFEPLQMKDTAYHVPEEKIDRLSALYGPAEMGGLELVESPQSSEYAKSRRLFSGSSGLLSTAADYFRFSQMLLNGGQLDGVRILGSKTVDFMFINHIPKKLLPMHLGDWVLAGMGFGLGGYVISNPAEAQVLESMGNFGWGGAYSTSFWIDRQEDIICLLMTQLEPFGFYPLQEQLKVLTYQALVD